jgi:hypothetical protein
MADLLAMTLTPLFLIAALNLSATDLRDLRCLYVFESRAVAESGSGERDKSAADQNVAQWFRGRLSVSQPHMSVAKYLKHHFYDFKVAVTRADIESCSAVIGGWQARESGPIR